MTYSEEHTLVIIAPMSHPTYIPSKDKDIENREQMKNYVQCEGDYISVVIYANESPMTNPPSSIIVMEHVLDNTKNLFYDDRLKK